MRKHRIFLISLLCFIAGVGLASFLSVPQIFIVAGLILGALAMIYFVITKNPNLWFGFFVIVFILGIWRFQIKSEKPVLPTEQGQKIETTFTGIVSQYPDERLDKAYLILSYLDFSKPINSYSNVPRNIGIRKQGELAISTALAPDVKIRVTTPRIPQYHYGDKLLIKGKISQPENFADFNYKNYLAKDNIYLVSSYPEIQLVAHNQGNWLKQKLFAVREKFSDSLNDAIKEPEAAFAQGLLLGSTSKLPQEIQDNFRIVGLSHVIALSGFNITIIASFLVFIFAVLTLKREWSFWLAVIGIFCFVILTGAQASVVRAAVMGILVLVAQREGRLYSIKNALALAAAVMIWLNPKVLRFDTGFQLSFLATLGLVYLAPRLEKILEKMPKLLNLKECLIATLSAQFAVLPLILSSFGRFSVIAPVANILVLPVIPFAMLFSFIAGILQMIIPVLGNIAGFAAEIFLVWPLAVSGYLAAIPLASFQLGFGLIFLIVYAVVLWMWMKVKQV